MKYIQFALLLFSISIISCSKDGSNDSGNNTTSVKTTAIAASPWMVDNAAVRVGTSDIPQTLSACVMDNTFTFKADGTGTMTEGANVCTGSSPTTSYTWAFANSESALNVSGISLGGVAGPFKILELTSTRLSLAKDSTYMGISGSFIVNLKH